MDTLAFEFMVLTAARSGEVRGAAWSEIDKDARVWTVPASRMKTARAQRVPLCSERLTRLFKRHRIAAVPLSPLSLHLTLLMGMKNAASSDWNS